MSVAREGSQENSTLHLLQVYRGLAALAVLLFHAAGLVYDKSGSAGVGRLFAWGFNGVPLFFVLSGYIIAFIHIGDVNNPRRALKYLYKRFARIYPIYWFVFLLFLPIYIDSVAAAPGLFVIENITLLKITGFGKILLVAWTLSHEILFYLVFLLLVVNRKLGLVAVLIWLSFIAYALKTGHVVPLPYILSTASGIDYGVFTSFATLVSAPINLLFMLGVLSYFVGKVISTHIYGELMAQYAFAAGVALFVAACSYWVYKTTGRIFDNDAVEFQIICGIASFFLILSASSRRLDEWAKRRSVLLFLGGASYSIYLMHYTIQEIIVNNFFFPIDSSVAFLAVSLMSIAAGVVVHKFVENPILGFLSRSQTKLFLRTQS